MIIYYTPKVSKTFGVSETTTVKEQENHTAKVKEIIKKVEEIHTPKGILLPEGFENLRGVGNNNRKGVGKPYREGYGNNQKGRGSLHTPKGILLPEGFGSN